MPIQNPLSIPGGWKKDNAKDTPAVEEPNPVESQTIPRTPAGVVSETGGILDDAGRTIGKVTESEDGQSLVGKTVTSTGDIIDKSTGDVLGRASLDSDEQEKSEEYTTGDKPQEDTQSQKSGSGFFGTVRSGLGFASSNASKKDDAGSEQAPSEAPKPEGQDADTAKDAVKDTAEDASSDVPADDSTTQDTTDNISNEELTPEDAQSQQGANKQPSKDGSITLDDREQDDAAEDTSKDNGDEEKSAIPESTTAGKDKSQADVDLDDKPAETEKGLEEAKSQANAETDDKTAETQEGLEEAKSQANVDADDKTAETQEGLGEDKSQANLDVGDKAAETQEGLDEAKSQANDNVDDKTAETQEGLEENKSQANVDVDDKTAETQEGLDETKSQANVDADDKTAETQEGLEETKSQANVDDKPAEAQEGLEDAKSQVDDKAAETQEGLDETKSQVDDKAAETQEGLDETKSQANVDAEDKTAETQENLDDTKSQANVDADDKTADTQEGLDETKSQANVDVPEASEKDVGDEAPLDEQSKPDATTEEPETKDAEGVVPTEGEPAAENKEEEKDESAEQEEEDQGKKLDYSILKGGKVNKVGNIVNDKGDVVGRIVDGEAKKLQGKRSDEEGNIWSDSGKIIGKAEPLSDDEREDKKKSFAPFENFPNSIVEADGRVMSEGRQVGTVVEGDAKRLKGSKVDEDGDILDRNGNTVGRAEVWDEPEPIPEEVEQAPDRSILAGKRVNKAGNVVDSSGTIFGKVVEGNVSSMVGRMCDKEGNIRSESGDFIGRAEVVPEGEREGSKEGPFAELSGLTVRKDGKVVTPSDEVVGRLISGDPAKLFGRSVDEDGDVVDKNGNTLGKAERYEEPEEVVEEKKKGPLFGRKVNKEGNVVDEDGNVIAKLVSGELLVCSGKEIDDDGDVINSKGNTVGHVALIEDIPEPEPEPEEEEEEVETEEQKKEREQAEADHKQAETDRKLAGQLAGCIEQSLDKMKPICKLITDKIDKAERTPKEELDEEQLVREVKPLIEEGGKILSETNGTIRGLDPDGRIQRQAKHKSGTREATSEEHHLAEQLKELTGNVSQTVDNAKRKIEGMPKAKKELNPLWGLLMEPLGQILAAVGLLLTGVLGLVGKLLSGLGLGGLVDGLLGGLGLSKILGSLGLGSAYDALVGKKKK